MEYLLKQKHSMTLPKVNIRTATLDDLPVLLNFEQEIIKAERPFDVTIKEGPVSYYDIGEMIQDSKAHVVVAESEDKVVASGYAIPKRARHYLDHEFYVHRRRLSWDGNQRFNCRRIKKLVQYQWFQRN